MRAPPFIITAVVGLIVNVSVAHASTATFVTPTGSSTGGGPVDASATFTTGPGLMSVVLQNLQANPTDVAQLLSDLDFTLSTGATTGSGLLSLTTPISVAGDGTTTLGTPGSSGWVLNNNVSGGLQLDVLGTSAGPSMLIIGPPGAGGVYSNANGSIAGNGPHNPFSNQMVQFSIDVAGLTAAATVTSATFSFGTTAGVNVAGEVVPLPAALPLFGTGLGAMGLLAWRRKRKAQAVA
jgi:hypothetical protein